MFGTFVRIDIPRDRDASKMCLSQAALIDRLLEQEFLGILRRENLTSSLLTLLHSQILLLFIGCKSQLEL